MENIYLILVLVLFIMAVSDLIVGVANDAVNFLNSAVGSKAASIKLIFAIASAGVLAGVLFSGGMMEVARSGIFNPDKFSFAEVMIIFLAVMITDVILLDLFNTMGLPTSTTVSLVFELLGAAVGIAIIKISGSAEPGNLGEYINSAKALAIISGILLSVVLAFASGSLLQYITRLIFSFDYERAFRKWGSLFASLGLTMILYFLLVKGAKGAAFMTKELQGWINENQFILIITSFLFFTIVFRMVQLFTKTNILKIVVLAGTFALAMAFAGNDLVNFIGVPLAGLDSFKYAIESGGDFESLTMEVLKGDVSTPTIILVAAGVIMVVTLYKSRKARRVIETEVNLGRQDQGYERFDSTQLSRAIVKLSVSLSGNLNNWLPSSLKEKIARRFEPSVIRDKSGNGASFDMLRASVNLLASSALIALGTSMKLPLSTTYVTFMVAMGTSLADGAWGRDSAVYRVTGVLSVIGGWFFTAFSAFTIALLLALLFNFGGVIAVFAVILVAMFQIYHTQKIIVRRDKDNADVAGNSLNVPDDQMDLITLKLFHVLDGYYEVLMLAYENRELRKLKSKKREMELVSGEISGLRDRMLVEISGDMGKDIEKCNNLVTLAGVIDRLIYGLGLLSNQVIDHIQNNHKDLSSIQKEEISLLIKKIECLVKGVALKAKGSNDYESLLQIAEEFKRNEINRIRNGKESARNSLLFTSIMQELKYFLYNLQRVEQLVYTEKTQVSK